MVEDKSLGSRLFTIFNYIFLTLFASFCLLPFWIMIVASFTPNNELATQGYWLWSQETTTEAYTWVLNGRDVRIGYQVSVFVTLFGTLASLIIMSGLAYVLSLRRFKGRRKLAFFIFFTMIFNGGMIPWFITVRNVLGLHDNIWALIVPMICSAFWVLVMRGFFENLPPEIMESAYLDGASDAQILYHIVIPLSKPVLATVGLFMGVAFWNDWFLGTMLLDFAGFRPLPVIILRMINNVRAIQVATQIPGASTAPLTEVPTYAIRMAMAVITIGPIFLIVPFVQRYFVRGLTLGGIKG
jgi:putative aldouronate transport system permease protein